MVSARVRREPVAYLETRGLSRRRACALLSVARSTVGYQSRLSSSGPSFIVFRPNIFEDLCILLLLMRISVRLAYRSKGESSIFWAMPHKDCRVVMTDPQGVKRSVQVTAETLFEAAAIAVHAFKRDGFTDFISSVFEIEVTEPVVKHQVSIGQIRTWLDSSVSDPRERIGGKS